MKFVKETIRNYKTVFVAARRADCLSEPNWDEACGSVDSPNVSSSIRGISSSQYQLVHSSEPSCPITCAKRSFHQVGGWKGKKTAAEVYPHPAMVRMFGLTRIIKYKKGRVAERRKEFQGLQGLMRKMMKRKFPGLRISQETRSLLREKWSNPLENRTDALFCALIEMWYWMHRGKRSEVIGDRKTGFILLPDKSN